MALYTVTLTGEQIAEIRLASEEGAILNDDTLAALDAAKPSRARAPKTVAVAPVEVLVSQGDPALDAFLAAHHRNDWRGHLASALKNRPGLMRMPAPPKGHDPIALKPHERAALYEAHRVRQISA